MESTMTRLLNGLNREIKNIIELQHYVELGKQKKKRGNYWLANILSIKKFFLGFNGFFFMRRVSLRYS